MPKTPTLFTRPHALHQSLQQQAHDARADRPHVVGQTWPWTTSTYHSEPVTAALHISVNSPYLLTKALKPARRLPPPNVNYYSFGHIASLPPASSFFYSSTKFFEYSTPTPATMRLEQTRGRMPLRESNGRNRPQTPPKAKNIAPACTAQPSTIAAEPRKNTYKRLRRDSLPQPSLAAQRNTVAFPSSDAEPVEGQPACKRARAGSSAKSAPRPAQPDLQPPEMNSMSFHDLFYKPLSTPPRKKKRSRRQRLYGHNFPAQSFVPCLKAIEEDCEDVEDISPFGVRNVSIFRGYC